MGKNRNITKCVFMDTHICSTRCLFMGKIIRSNIDFVYVNENCLFAHIISINVPPTGTYYFTYNYLNIPYNN